MTGDQYLQGLLVRESVDTGLLSPVRAVQKWLMPMITEWAADNLLTVHPSGSFLKGTAIKSGTDIDLFISLSENTPHTLQDIYEKLFSKLEQKGYSPRRQNVSLNIKALGYSVDLVPAKRQNAISNDHSLYVRKANTWQKTNVVTHVAFVQAANRLQETKILKLWRNQRGLDLPSFYLEMVVARALVGRQHSPLTSSWSSSTCATRSPPPGSSTQPTATTFYRTSSPPPKSSRSQRPQRLPMTRISGRTW
jgi:hypothetical protein